MSSELLAQQEGPGRTPGPSSVPEINDPWWVGEGGRGYGAPSGYALAVLLILAGLVLLGRRLLVASRS